MTEPEPAPETPAPPDDGTPVKLLLPTSRAEVDRITTLLPRLEAEDAAAEKRTPRPLEFVPHPLSVTLKERAEDKRRRRAEKTARLAAELADRQNRNRRRREAERSR